MSIKWAAGAVIAVLAGMFLLPGLASAHEAELQGDPSCRNAQGGFTIDWTLSTSQVQSNRELDGFDDSGYDPGGNDQTETPDNGVIDVVDGGVAPSLGLADFTVTESDSGPTGQTLNVDGIHGNGSASAQTVYDGSDDPNQTIFAQGRVQWTPTNSNSQTTFEQNVQSDNVERPDYCKESACLNGDITEQAVNELVNTADCGFFNACINGEVERINEHDAELEGIEEGVCDHENPPPPPPAEEDPPVEEEDEPEAVAEVSPAVDEVAALPSAGQGSGPGVGYTWIALFALALAGFGGATALMARK